MAKKMSGAAIIGATFGCDSREISECRYQPTRTPCAVYAISDRYFTVNQHQPVGLLDRTWQQHTDQFWAQQAGTVLWVADASEA